MNYYILSQDRRISDCVKPLGITKLIDRDLLMGNTDKLDDTPVQFYIKEKDENEYIDIIETPVLLISDKLKRVLEVYQKEIFFKPVLLADVKRMRQDLYWFMIPKTVECLSPQTEFFKDGAVKKLVIDEKKANPHKVFRVGGIFEYIVIVNLDIAENILKRDIYGIELKKANKE